MKLITKIVGFRIMALIMISIAVYWFIFWLSTLQFFRDIGIFPNTWIISQIISIIFLTGYQINVIREDIIQEGIKSFN